MKEAITGPAPGIKPQKKPTALPLRMAQKENAQSFNEEEFVYRFIIDFNLHRRFQIQ